MVAIERNGDSFMVPTPRFRYRARNVLLSIGRRGTPRKLHVPGEELPKVVYRLIDSFQYRNRRVLVSGGGSAIEAALALAAEPGTRVTQSYRGAAFDRVKSKNRQRLESTRAVRVLLESNVVRILPTSVELEQRGQKVNHVNDDVLVCAGGHLPTAVLKSIGILIETHYGTAPARTPSVSVS